MASLVYVDFETRSKVDLPKVGAWRYAADPSTDILCMAYALARGPTKMWTPGQPFPAEILQVLRLGWNLEAHNAEFEQAIWAHVMFPRYKWPWVAVSRWTCSMARANAHALPRSLGGAGKALGLEIQKDQEGRRLMLKLCKPGEDGEFRGTPAEMQRLYDYCADDVMAERALSDALRPLTADEVKVWELDQKINARGVMVDLPAVKGAIAIMEAYRSRLTGELREITGGAVQEGSEVLGLLEWVRGRGLIDMAGMTKLEVSEALKADIPQDVRRVLELRQQLGKTSTAKYEKILGAHVDGVLRGNLIYHGASTGRWTGAGVQIQNLPKNRLKGDFETYFELAARGSLVGFEMCYPDVLDTLSQCVRGCLVARPGKALFGGDFNAIEARVLFWLAGENHALQMFRDGADIYADLAKVIFNVEKPTDEQRDLGKRGVLGAGYGMGAKKFKDTAWIQAQLVVPDNLAERTIRAYRDKYSLVVKLWKNLEAAVIQAVKTKKPVKCGKVLWAVHKGFLYCRLPSGRCLAYYHPKIEPVETPWGEVKDQLTYMAQVTGKGWIRVSTYGGSLTENLCQAIARDLMAHGALVCEAAAYEILFTVHDELVAEKDQGTVKEFETLMATLPGWAQDIPVKVKGWTGPRYSK